MDSELTPEEERLYNAIETAMLKMGKKVPQEEILENMRMRFPSPVCLLEANAHSIAQTGLSKVNAFYFTIIPALSRIVQRKSFGQHPKLDRLSTMTEYLKTLFIGIHVECYYVALLSSTGVLIGTVLIGKGTENATFFDLKKTLTAMVEYSAKAAVLCHNHPGGTPQPSQEDVRCTIEAINASMALQIPILDHIIIARSQAISIRELCLISTNLWIMQSPKSKLLREWLDP